MPAAPDAPQEDDARLDPPDPMTRWNRGVLTFLAIAFLVMSFAVYLDRGATGQQVQLDDQGQLGREVWMRENCMVCHQFFGMGGYMGPDLTNVARRIGPETIAWVIENGRGSMPAFELDEEELAAVTAYLVTMDSTGTFPMVDQWPPGWFPTSEAAENE